mgnify:CR=1 FL=1
MVRMFTLVHSDTECLLQRGHHAHICPLQHPHWPCSYAKFPYNMTIPNSSFSCMDEYGANAIFLLPNFISDRQPGCCVKDSKIAICICRACKIEFSYHTKTIVCLTKRHISTRYSKNLIFSSSE